MRQEEGRHSDTVAFGVVPGEGVNKPGLDTTCWVCLAGNSNGWLCPHARPRHAEMIKSTRTCVLRVCILAISLVPSVALSAHTLQSSSRQANQSVSIWVQTFFSLCLSPSIFFLLPSHFSSKSVYHFSCFPSSRKHDESDTRTQSQQLVSESC